MAKKARVIGWAKVIGFSQSSGETPCYRVWHAQNPPHYMTYYAVQNVEGAKALIEKLSKADLADKSIVSYAFGLEELEDGEYHEWHSDEEQSVTEILAEEDGDDDKATGDMGEVPGL